jgi:hypothetical protein
LTKKKKKKKKCKQNREKELDEGWERETGRWKTGHCAVKTNTMKGGSFAQPMHQKRKENPVGKRAVTRQEMHPSPAPFYIFFLSVGTLRLIFSVFAVLLFYFFYDF